MYRLSHLVSIRVKAQIRVCILGLLLSASLFAFADGLITGVVRDPSGAPVTGAQVTARSDGKVITAQTDSEGRFRIRTPFERATVQVEAEGFRSIDLQWPAARDLVFNLPIGIRSEMVSVTAHRTELPLRDTPSTLVIDRPALQSSGALAIDDALRQVPGFTLFRRSGSLTSNPTTQGVSLRGVGASGASRALVLQNGIPVNDPFGGWIYWGRVPREAIEAVEVVRGGQSDLYGSDALGGVINLRNRQPRESALTLEGSLGNRSTPFGSALGSLRRGNWIGTFAGEGFRTGGYVPVPEDIRGPVDAAANSRHWTADTLAERLFGESGRIFLAGSYYDERRNNGKIDEGNSAIIRQLSTGGDGRFGLGNVSFRLFGGTEELRQNFFAVADDRTSERITRDQTVPVQQVGFSGQWSRAAAKIHTFLAGVEGRWIEGESAEVAFAPTGSATALLRNGGRQQTIGLFGEDILRFGSRVLVTLAARVDRWGNTAGFSSSQPLASGALPALVQFTDRDEVAFSPRGSLLFRATDHVSAHASVYRAFRAPTLNELYRGFRVGDVLTLANPDLEAERLTGGETGINVQPAEQLTLRGTFFWNEVAGPVANVTLDITPELISRQRQNLGSTRARGVEFEAEARVSPNFMLSGGYQFADSTVIEAPGIEALVGKLLPQVPRHEVTLQARFSNERFVTAALQGRFQGVQYDDDRNQFELERFFTLDASLSRALNRNVDVFLAGENLLNSRYTIGRTPVRTIAPPTLARVGLRIRLGSR